MVMSANAHFTFSQGAAEVCLQINGFKNVPLDPSPVHHALFIYLSYPYLFLSILVQSLAQFFQAQADLECHDRLW